jgi:hypothetical protein
MDMGLSGGQLIELVGLDDPVDRTIQYVLLPSNSFTAVVRPLPPNMPRLQEFASYSSLPLSRPSLPQKPNFPAQLPKANHSTVEAIV